MIAGPLVRFGTAIAQQSRPGTQLRLDCTFSLKRTRSWQATTAPGTVGNLLHRTVPLDTAPGLLEVLPADPAAEETPASRTGLGAATQCAFPRLPTNAVPSFPRKSSGGRPNPTLQPDRLPLLQKSQQTL